MTFFKDLLAKEPPSAAQGVAEETGVECTQAFIPPPVDKVHALSLD